MKTSESDPEDPSDLGAPKSLIRDASIGKKDPAGKSSSDEVGATSSSVPQNVEKLKCESEGEYDDFYALYHIISQKKVKKVKEESDPDYVEEDTSDAKAQGGPLTSKGIDPTRVRKKGPAGKSSSDEIGATPSSVPQNVEKRKRESESETDDFSALERVVSRKKAKKAKEDSDPDYVEEDTSDDDGDYEEEEIGDEESDLGDIGGIEPEIDEHDYEDSQ